MTSNERESLPADGRGTRRLACRETTSEWRIANEFERAYGTDCPEHVRNLPTETDDWTRVRDVTASIGLYEYRGRSTPRPTPSTHRPATVFENEIDDMTSEAIPLLRELLNGDAVVTEMPYANNYRTDVVICQIDEDAVRRRLELTGDQRTLNEEWRYLKGHRYLRHVGPLTEEEFIEDGLYVESTNREVWRWLHDRNLIARTRSGFYTAVNYPIHVTAHAIELKRRDWETALEQALRSTTPEDYCDYWAPNRHPGKYGYSDYQYVGIDAGQLPKMEDYAEEFRRHGVGLIAIVRGGAVKLIDAEKKEPPERGLDREHINEKALEKIDADEYVDGIVNDGQNDSRGGEVQTGFEEFR